MISVIILTKNEEEVIKDCVESMKGFAQKIVVIDSNSTDKTVDIAENLKAEVYKNKFIDFSKQRNFAFSKVSFDWILYIDADERLTDEFKKEVKGVLDNFREENGIGGFFIKRKTFFFGKNWGLSDKMQRLFYKKNFIGWEGVVHETPKI